MSWLDRLRPPLPPLRRIRWSDFPANVLAAFAVLFLAVPQGLAYATVAQLPPVMGLYAASIPTIVGSLTRSSRHVISGPSNALSLLVGGSVGAMLGHDPVTSALLLALMVGLLQTGAGLLRLGGLVDYISSAVVLGYVTGAAVLIAAGQLYAALGISGPRGALGPTVIGVAQSLAQAHWGSVSIAAGTMLVIVGTRLLSRRIGRRLPAAIIAMAAATTVSIVFDLEALGLFVLRDLAPIPRGLPSMALPPLDAWLDLLPAAIACTVLSLVESTSVARSIASRTGQRLEPSTEFFGQGLSNVAAGLFGGYPVSGSLARSELNLRTGARSRLAGVLTGSFMLALLPFSGPLLERVPLAGLAGLLLVIAWDLVDPGRIRRTLRTSNADAIAFLATMLGMWTLSLDDAIYLGIGISLVLYLRRAKLLIVRELIVDEEGLLREADFTSQRSDDRCPRIRLLHVEGSLFFGAAGELQTILDDAARPSDVRVVVVRLKRAHGLDVTTAAVVEHFARQLRVQGRHLLLVGMDDDTMRVLERSGVADAIGSDNLFPTRKRWFAALDAARERAVALCGRDCGSCPLARAHLRASAEPDPVRPD
jgi:sulfate permease, SulP family